jgi:hypothetical protein
MWSESGHVSLWWLLCSQGMEPNLSDEDQQKVYEEECIIIRFIQYEFKQLHPEEKVKFIVKNNQREGNVENCLVLVMRSTETTAVQAFEQVDLQIQQCHYFGP